MYFGKELYMFRTDFLSIIRSLNTVYTARGICRKGYADCLLAGWGWFYYKNSGAYHETSKELINYANSY